MGSVEKQKEVPRLDQPPAAGGSSSYVIPQLEGEILSIPGSKSVFRILTSAVQTDDTISVFSSGGALADAPGFHHHDEAHDVFIVTKGFLKLWNGDKCRIMGPGDFAYVPPGTIHNPHLLGPTTETLGLITPASWLDFFRHVAEPYAGLHYPEHDARDLAALLIPKVLAAPRGRFDVHFHPRHVGAPPSDWVAADEALPDGGGVPYFLRANTGPRWLAGGVLVRPAATTEQTGGRFAVAGVEGSARFRGANPFARAMAFPGAHQCFVVMEGVLVVEVAGAREAVEVREGEAVFVAAGERFALGFGSKFVRAWCFASGDGVEAVVRGVGRRLEGVVLPDEADEVDEGRLRAVAERLGVLM